MAEEAKWYVVHTYSGYENAVAAAVMKAAENRKMTDLIREVNIPMETVTEFTDNGDGTYTFVMPAEAVTVNVEVVETVVTAVTDITAAQADENAPIYDLMGRRLTAKPSQGIYIQNGRKHIAR